MKFKRNIRYREICISKQSLSLIHYFIPDILLRTNPFCRGYNLIQIIRGNTKFIRIILNRMLLFQMALNQLHKYVNMDITNLFGCSFFFHIHFLIFPVQQHQDFIK